MSFSVSVNYPSGFNVYPTPYDHVSPLDATYLASLHQAISRIEQELGTDPSGSAPTVRARLDAMVIPLDCGVASVTPTAQQVQINTTSAAETNIIVCMARTFETPELLVWCTITNISTGNYFEVKVSQASASTTTKIHWAIFAPLA